MTIDSLPGYYGETDEERRARELDAYLRKVAEWDRLFNAELKTLRLAARARAQREKRDKGRHARRRCCSLHRSWAVAA